MAASPTAPAQQKKKDLYTEEKAKVVAASWGDRIASITCCTSYFAPGRVEEQADLQQDELKNMMI